MDTVLRVRRQAHQLELDLVELRHEQEMLRRNTMGAGVFHWVLPSHVRQQWQLTSCWIAIKVTEWSLECCKKLYVDEVNFRGWGWMLPGEEREVGVAGTRNENDYTRGAHNGDDHDVATLVNGSTRHSHMYTTLTALKTTFLMNCIPTESEREQLQGMECRICMEPLVDGTESGQCVPDGDDVVDEQVPVILPCHPQHAFHAECIRIWLDSHGTCPYDRIVHREYFFGKCDD